MKEQKIIVKIESDGKISAEAEGFAGDTCLAELERLLDGLAITWVDVRRKTDEGDKLLTKKSNKSVSKETKR